MKVKSYTRKCHKYNEDRFINGKNFNLVIDGATPLIKNGENSSYAHKAVQFIKDNINKEKGSIGERLEVLSHKLADIFNIENENPSHSMSASLSYVYFDGDNVRIGIVGDCEVAIKTINGKVIRYYDDTLSHFDDAVIKKSLQLSKEKNITIKEARQLVNEDLITNRNKANRKDGYNSFILSKNYQFKEKAYSMKKHEIKEILLYSDGFASCFTLYNSFDNVDDIFNVKDLKTIIKNIEKKSFSDKNFKKYPRFKIIDDITVTKIVL